MIIGLEWPAIILFGSFIILWIIGLVVHSFAGRLSTILVISAVVCEVVGGGLVIGLMGAQKNIEEHYVEYLSLQVQIAQYDDLDLAEQYTVANDVMIYNLWYEKNKSALENEWSFKGSSDYAKEFEYLVIGGK